jgi:hypothetical protein
MGLHPNVSYHLVPGLVALFAKVASCTRNTRAPHTHPHATTGFSYAVVVKSPMENGKFNGGNRGYNQWYGGVSWARHETRIYVYLWRFPTGEPGVPFGLC